MNDAGDHPNAEPRTGYQPHPGGPVGVLDSGVGGLSVLVHLRRLLPTEDMIYFADQDHIPYGPRPASEIQAFTAAITRFLLARKAKMVVVACNTATAASLDYLRETFPAVLFVGMEPAVKPAALTTRSGKVGVLATPSTLNSHRYAALMARYAAGIVVYEDPCFGLVQLIEAGSLASPQTRALLQRVVEPMLAEGVDTLVLGCTHYPFVRPLLEEIAGDGVTIIDPAPAVARHTRFVLQQHKLQRYELDQVEPTANPVGDLRCYTSGLPERLEALARLVLEDDCAIQQVQWQHGEPVEMV